YRHVRRRLVPGGAWRRARDPGQEHRSGHGCRDHRRGVHRRGHRRPGLVLGHVSRRRHFWSGACVRHPGGAAIFHLRRFGTDGGDPHRASVGVARAARAMTVLRRTPWLLIVFIAALYVPWLGSRFYTFLATQITILALFAVSLNLLLGYKGLVSYGHAAYFGIGAYTCAILMKNYGVPFLGAFAAAGVMAASFGLVFGFFCVRLTRIYFAMLTLAFAHIVCAICFKWNDVTGGEQGLSNVPYPELDWLSSLPGFGGLRAGELF